MSTKGICLIWSWGRLFSPSLSCRGQGIGKQRGTISSWHKRTAGRNLVVYRHGTTFRQSVQRYRCRLYFCLFFSHFDIEAGKSPEDIVATKKKKKKKKHSRPPNLVDGMFEVWWRLRKFLRAKKIVRTKNGFVLTVFFFFLQ